MLREVKHVTAYWGYFGRNGAEGGLVERERPILEGRARQNVRALAKQAEMRAVS